MMNRVSNRWQAENGTALMEFSLIAFTFVLLLLGVVEMGRMILVYTTIANAAKVGERYAIVHGGDRTGTGVNGPSGPASSNTSQVQTVVQNFSSAGLLTTSNLVITVAYPNGTNTAGSPVTVTVTYPYDPFIAFFNPLLNQTLSSTSEGIITF